MDVSAVAADPYDLFTALKNDALFEIFEQCIIALLMLFFNLADHLKERSYAVEASSRATSANSLYISVHS